MKFEVGNTVEWTSQANGRKKFKRGVVVAIVPARYRLGLSGLLGDDYRERFNRSTVDGGFWGRKHDSYLISVPTKSGRGRPRLYWPRVSLLRKSIPDATAIDHLERELLQESDLIGEERES